MLLCIIVSFFFFFHYRRLTISHKGIIGSAQITLEYLSEKENRADIISDDDSCSPVCGTILRARLGDYTENARRTATHVAARSEVHRSARTDASLLL